MPVRLVLTVQAVVGRRCFLIIYSRSTGQLEVLGVPGLPNNELAECPCSVTRCYAVTVSGLLVEDLYHPVRMKCTYDEVWERRTRSSPDSHHLATHRTYNATELVQGSIDVAGMCLTWFETGPILTVSAGLGERRDRMEHLWGFGVPPAGM